MPASDLKFVTRGKGKSGRPILLPTDKAKKLQDALDKPKRSKKKKKESK